MAALIDTDTIASLRAEGDELLIDLIAIFMQETPDRLKLLADALEADDARWAERMAHTLKNSAATLGAWAMRKIALEVESAAHTDDLAKARQLFDALKIEVRRAQEALRAERTRLTA